MLEGRYCQAQSAGRNLHKIPIPTLLDCDRSVRFSSSARISADEPSSPRDGRAGNSTLGTGARRRPKSDVDS
jgi:hypothetical protein